MTVAGLPAKCCSSLARWCTDMLALVPVKTFKAAKQRLSAMLTAAEREALSAAMLSDVLRVLSGHDGIERVAICAADPAVAALAHGYGVDYLDETQFQCSGLN